MNAVNKIQNEAEKLAGKAKEAVGKITGDKEKTNEGQADQVKGNLKNAGENVKDAFGR